MAKAKDDTTTEAETKAEQAKADPAVAEKEAKAKELADAAGPDVRVNDPTTPEAIAEQHRMVDEAKEKRNEENREGHAVNMQRIEQDALEAQARTEHHADPRARHTPTGKEQNRNTPRILPDGTKVWE